MDNFCICTGSPLREVKKCPTQRRCWEIYVIVSVAKGRHVCSSKEVFWQWRKLCENEHHPEEIMHTTHMKLLISAKSPRTDEPISTI